MRNTALYLQQKPPMNAIIKPARVLTRLPPTVPTGALADAPSKPSTRTRGRIPALSGEAQVPPPALPAWAFLERDGLGLPACLLPPARTGSSRPRGKPGVPPRLRCCCLRAGFPKVARRRDRAVRRPPKASPAIAPRRSCPCLPARETHRRRARGGRFLLAVALPGRSGSGFRFRQPPRPAPRERREEGRRVAGRGLRRLGNRAEDFEATGGVALRPPQRKDLRCLRSLVVEGLVLV